MRRYISIFKFVFVIAILSYTSVGKAQEFHKVEKMYTHTDRPFYFPGETIWFKTYAVDEANIPSAISDVLVTELISPAGDVVQTKRYYLDLGCAFGDFQLKKEWVGGVYTLRSYSQYMRNQGDESFFTKEITVQKVVVPQLLVSLDFDRESYGKGSEFSADYKVEDLNNKPLGNAAIEATLYLDGRETARQDLKTLSDGTQKIRFKLPDDLNTVDAVLVVQTTHLGNTESISRSVPVLLDKLDLQFMPEGGKLLMGAANRLAFKALDPYGRPADVSGRIVDESGEEVLAFSSFHDGMGSLLLKPEVNKQYFAQITQPFESDSLYALPKTTLMGAQLRVLNQDEGALNIEVFTTSKLQGKLVLFDATQQELIKKTVTLPEGVTPVTIPVNDLARGIVKLQLQDGAGIILSERLVFLNAEKALQIQLTPDKENYLPREPVNLEITTTDATGKALSSNLSLAVVDNALLTLADDKQDRIDSYLLMSSELKGRIHEPSFYFDEEEPKRAEALDLIMLTHGWRDYLQKPVPEGINLKYNPERRDIIYGRIENMKGEPVEAQVFIIDRNGKKILSLKTGLDGSFQFRPGEVSTLVVAAYSDDRQELRIELDETLVTKYGNPDFRFFGNRRETKTPEVLENIPESPLAKPLQAQVSDLSLNDDKASLDEVVVVGYGVYERANSTSIVEVVDNDELQNATGNIAQLLQGRVAGIEITRAEGNGNTQIQIRGSASIRGGNEPLILVDGIPMNGNAPNSFDLSQLDASQVEAVQVVKGVAAHALYGSRGANGVILITTKSRNYWKKKVLFSQKYKNYAIEQVYTNNQEVKLNQPAIFYMPVYEDREIPEKRNDFRKTLYWNPLIQTDAEGKANLKFYNSDALTSFKIVAEGIAAVGTVGHSEKAYSISQPLRLMSKLPAYASIGDTLHIPLRIINDSDRVETLALELEFSEALTVLNKAEIPDNVVLNANSFKVVHLKVLAKEAGESIRFKASVKGSKSSDAFEERLTVVSPYFPVETNISNTTSGSYSFDIVNAIPGSIKGDFSLYVDVVGELMNGVEGMIRKPYGCFEQTSSATYPNVMVLQYLKATGKSNPEVEQQALDFIKEGYKRLISFETREGGFEWFGHTPPHQTLTAFGILEFTEMKEVYPDVSDKMLQRTTNWLLNQRDGKGGFHKSTKGYDSFASSPPLVANAFIVYALSEVGITEEIRPEYEEALKKALGSKDAYQMALMALAAHNFGELKTYNELLQNLVSSYRKDGFEWNTRATITRSYGNAKNLETTAFVILAALRENKHSDVVSEGVQFIAENRKNLTFGSTQTTVMCLKALLTYNRTQVTKLIESESLFNLEINGTHLSPETSEIENGVVHLDSIQQYIKGENQKLGLTFNDPDLTVPYAFNFSWKSSLPKNAEFTPVVISTQLTETTVQQGDLARLEVEVRNTTPEGKGMITALVGIPSGASVQPYQLKELMEEGQIAYYEVTNNYVIFYWRSIEASEILRLNLDLKTEVAGTFTAAASTVYPYYGEDLKFWAKGTQLTIEASATDD